MKVQDGQLQTLEEHSVSLLRSGVYLNSFTHALQSLLEISIRSGANNISSSIDPAIGTICVDDNGVGLDTRLVNLFGRFDSNSAVSRLSTEESPGTQITSYLTPSQHRVLDSLAHLSLLDICSRQEDANYTHQTLFREGKVIFSAPARTSRRHNHGTTTTVRDLFHNLPVRQIRENDPTRHQQRLKRQWEESRLALQSLAIVYPHITFILRNSSHQTLAATNPAGYYRLSKTGLFSSTFGKIFGQQFVQDSIPLNVSMDGFRVTGLFSRKRHSSRAIQFIYLNRVLITSNSLVHKSIASLFAGLISQDTSGSSASRTSMGTQTNPASKNGASSVERHPVYLLLFTSLPDSNPSHHDTNFLDEREQYLIPQTEEKMNRIASRIFSQVFLPVKDVLSSSTSERKPGQDSSLKRTLQSRWPVTKRPCLSHPSSPTRPSAPQFLSLNGPFSAPPKKHISRSADHRFQHKPPVTKLKSRIEAGKTNPKKQTGCSVHVPHIQSSTASSGKSLSLRSMIPNLRSRFGYKPSTSSAHLPSMKTDRMIASPSQAISFHPQCGQKRNQTPKFDGVTIVSEGGEFRIDLSQLTDSSKFTVVGQLDMKFIIVKIDGHSRPDLGQDDGLIVAFDQHAVHERIRIERFLQEVCSGNFNVKQLKTQTDLQQHEAPIHQRGIHEITEKLVPLLVNRNEFDGLTRFKKLFDRWGFIYELIFTESTPINEEEDDEMNGGFKQVFMRAVPELIWQRVQCNDGQFELLKSILRGCLGFFEDRFRDQNLSLIDHQSIVRDSHRDWFASVKDCPTVLIDLLNSKACRGSIMFGDKLTNNETRKLLTELGGTRLPFSCAHGRPTCYPLYKFREHMSSTSLFDPPKDTHPWAFAHPLSEHASSQSSSLFPNHITNVHLPFKPSNSFHRRKIHWESLAG